MNNKYCVYVHRDNNGVVRYVGSGTLRRAKNLTAKSNRGLRYQEFVEKYGKLSVEILHTNLSKDDAIQLEISLYEKYTSDVLFNKNKPSWLKPVPKIEILNELFDVNLNSKSGLTWKRQASQRIKVGDDVGTLTKNGYYAVGINGSIYLTHRVLAVMLGKDVTGKIIDHKNHLRTDNSPDNLVITDSYGNMRNRSKLSNNTTGITGVHFSFTDMKWIASWQDNDKRVTKSFSVNKYGDAVARQLAIDARKEAETRLSISSE